MTSFSITGEISGDHSVLAWKGDITYINLERIHLRTAKTSEIWPTMVFRQQDVILTNWFLSATIYPPRLLIDQSYESITLWAEDLRVKFFDDKFVLHSDFPELIRGPHVILGGPIDGVWYHWLANWSTRILALQMLRPDIFNDPEVKFIVDSSATRDPFAQIIRALGIPDDRLVVWNQLNDLHIEDAVIVSFLNQNYLYPDLMKILSARLKKHFISDYVDNVPGTNVSSVRPGLSARRRRVFASRQGFTSARRRVKNFAEIESILDEFGFDILELGKCTAEQQVNIFSEAEFVLGVHGSDLVNIMFSQPKTKVLVVENARNISSGLSVSLNVLSDIFDLDYNVLVVDEFIEDDVDYTNFNNLHYRDVIVPPSVLRDTLVQMGCHPII